MYILWASNSQYADHSSNTLAQELSSLSDSKQMECPLHPERAHPSYAHHGSLLHVDFLQGTI